jgi:hypothetical protein
MNEEPRSEFPATALIDTHVKVLDVAGAGMSCSRPSRT